MAYAALFALAACGGGGGGTGGLARGQTGRRVLGVPDGYDGPSPPTIATPRPALVFYHPTDPDLILFHHATYMTTITAPTLFVGNLATGEVTGYCSSGNLEGLGPREIGAGLASWKIDGSDVVFIDSESKVRRCTQGATALGPATLTGVAPALFGSTPLAALAPDGMVGIRAGRLATLHLDGTVTERAEPTDVVTSAPGGSPDVLYVLSGTAPAYRVHRLDVTSDVLTELGSFTNQTAIAGLGPLYANDTAAALPSAGLVVLLAGAASIPIPVAAADASAEFVRHPTLNALISRTPTSTTGTTYIDLSTMQVKTGPFTRGRYAIEVYPLGDRSGTQITYLPNEIWEGPVPEPDTLGGGRFRRPWAAASLKFVPLDDGSCTWRTPPDNLAGQEGASRVLLWANCDDPESLKIVISEPEQVTHHQFVRGLLTTSYPVLDRPFVRLDLSREASPGGTKYLYGSAGWTVTGGRLRALFDEALGIYIKGYTTARFLVYRPDGFYLIEP